MDRKQYISVIMPAYNAEDSIGAAIRSVQRQTYQNYELIIIDDGSTDHTHEIVEAFAAEDSRIKPLLNKKNMGTSFTRHIGVANAAGDWLAFLDSDDLWEPCKLKKQVLHQEKTGGNLIFTASAFMDSAGNRKDAILAVPAEVNYKTLLRQNIISNSSVLVRKSLYQKYESPGNDMHEDFACWLKILRSGETAYGINEPLLIYRLSTTSKSGNKAKSAIMNWHTYRNIGLPVWKAAYYEAFYAINGILKYRKLR